MSSNTKATPNPNSRSNNSPSGGADKNQQEDDEKKYQEEQAMKKFPRYNQHIIHRSEFSVITAGNNKNKRNNEVSYINSYINVNILT